MGKGINLVRDVAPEHAAVLDDFKDQLLIVLMKRLADKDGVVKIPIKEADDTGRDVLSFKVVDRVFHFQLGKKS
ncbi:MAG: hypothetical protein J2P55_01345 [Rhizobiales bacterium]|nr:hypothetical protein [Hyphomicrobiales bacterium]